ncbi:bifunctional glucose-1-phosphatase/inositol phosphatase [Orbus sturtevantii]|uniref:bifunctional glucose-1-phosphatase/inositol phosphatase n=1 Tax=Orbus sturtevantii TaxID=3074109 RepID=UPI00370D9E25
MKKSKFSKYRLLVCLPLLLSMVAEAADNITNYTLEQVVVFSRHGLRAPLSTPSSSLGKMTPNLWPQWDTQPSYLTTRGGVLEVYFGHYINEWLVANQLLTAEHCPAAGDIYIYANSLQRTIATGQYFSVGAFPGCNVPVVHKEKMGTMDAVFFPVIRDGSDAFKQRAIASINATADKVNGIDGLNAKLKPAYDDMQKVINYAKSANCQQNQQCDFASQPTEFNIVAGQEPGITGAIRTGTSIADAFILQYYEGSPLNEIAWGGIKNNAQFERLVSIKENYNTVVFAAPVVAKEVAANLIGYIDNTLINHHDKAKFTFLVGHDSNVASMFSALKIKPYVLPNQFETTPIGGKVFFERWKDNTTGQQFVKIEYKYQSTDQIRNLEQLSQTNPPQNVVLEMADCPIDKHGFCPFATFKTAMADSLK